MNGCGSDGLMKARKRKSGRTGGGRRNEKKRKPKEEEKENSTQDAELVEVVEGVAPT